MSIKKSLQELLESDSVKKSMTEKQINIIGAAIEIFSEKGFHGTTTSEIAKLAGVAEGTIFRYYKTKKDLLLAIPACLAEASFPQILLEDINEIFENKPETLEDFLRVIILNRRDFAIENMAILKVIFQEVPFHPELREKLSKTVFLPTMNRIVQVIDRFKEQGQIIDIPSNIIVTQIVTTVFGYFFSRYIANLDLSWNDGDDVEPLIQYILHGISSEKRVTN